jgi:hypothetical protein
MGPQRRSGKFGEKINLMPLQGVEARILGPSARSPLLILILPLLLLLLVLLLILLLIIIM